MPKLGQTISEKFTLERELGRGGMGQVFAAVHNELGHQVAIKFLNPELATDQKTVERFKREARAAAAIDHDAIIDVHDIGVTDEGEHYIVMEHLRGRTLDQKLALGGALSQELTALIGCQILSALVAAHEVGIIHRDLKPDNIFLVETGAALPMVKLLDFGISQLTERWREPETRDRLTRSGVVLGTPSYMSPENARGSDAIDQRSDLFSMGIILYECLTGSLPFTGANYNAILAAILTDPPSPPRERCPDLPPRLEALLLRALERAPEDRYQSAQEMFDDLLGFVDGLGIGQIAIPRESSKPEVCSPGAGVRAATREPRLSIESAPTLWGERPSRGERPWLKRAGAVVALVAVIGLGALLARAPFGLEEGLGSGGEAAEAEGHALAPAEDSGSPETGETSPAPDAAPAPSEEVVTFRLTNLPPGAQVFVDDVPVPSEALPDLRLTRSSSTARVRVVQAGRTFEATLDRRASAELDVELPSASPPSRPPLIRPLRERSTAREAGPAPVGARGDGGIKAYRPGYLGE